MADHASNLCAQCHMALPADAPGGLCPCCLMEMNLATGSFDSHAHVNQPVTLSPEEMTERFPNFEILDCLGRGGMGIVYRARQKRLDRDVAIKVLAGEWQGDAEFALRFEREAKILAQMSHPNIVTVHDFGDADGLYYIVMEYVDGVNLRDVLSDGKIEPEQALAIVPPICDALEYAHGKGVVHRDIKPENLLLDRDGRVKIADFGIASLIGAQSDVAGTPSYMAPEQIRGKVDRRADIYALGVVLYEMLTGETPGKDVVAPSKSVEVDVKIDEIVLRALEQEPEYRYQSVAELRTRTEQAMSSQQGCQEEQTPLPAWAMWWLSIPTLRRRTIFQAMLIVSVGTTFMFCCPSRELTSSGDVVTWGYGLADPWYESVRDQYQLHNYAYLNIASASFIMGVIACFHWIVLICLNHAESRVGTRLAIQQLLDDNGGAYPSWKGISVACLVIAGLVVVSSGMSVAIMQATLGGSPSPGPVMLINALASCLVLGALLSRPRDNGRTTWQAPDSGWGWLIGKMFGVSFTSRTAYAITNLSAFGFLGCLGYLGELPHFEQAEALFSLFGFFGLIGLGLIVERMQ